MTIPISPKRTIPNCSFWDPTTTTLIYIIWWRHTPAKYLCSTTGFLRTHTHSRRNKMTTSSNTNTTVLGPPSRSDQSSLIAGGEPHLILHRILASWLVHSPRTPRTWPTGCRPGRRWQPSWRTWRRPVGCPHNLASSFWGTKRVVVARNPCANRGAKVRATATAARVAVSKRPGTHREREWD